MPELTRRYIVMAMATEAPFDVHDPEAPFVLKPWKDPAALRALEAYRDHCYPELAGDLTGWIQAGMFSIGNTKPERYIIGVMKKKVEVIIACC